MTETIINGKQVPGKKKSEIEFTVDYVAPLFSGIGQVSYKWSINIFEH